MPGSGTGEWVSSRRCSRVHRSPSSRRRTRRTPLRPDLVGDPSLVPNQQTLARWFNTLAFVNPAPFTFGNSPRSVLRGPGIATTDMTLEKTVAITERVKFSVRVEAYNLLNHTNFNIPGFTLGAADFGVISSARAPRTM